MRKRKNEQLRPSLASFVLWWAVSYTALWIALWGLLEASPAAALNWPMCTIGTVVMLTMLSTLQAHLSRWFFNHPMQGWVDSGSIGSLVSIALLAAVSPIDPAKAALILTLPTVFVQTIWLVRYSKGALLWPLTSLLLILPTAQYGLWHEKGVFALLIALVGLAQGILQGILISRLWSAQLRQTKPQKLLLSDHDEHETAIQRLSVRETHESPQEHRSLLTPQSREANLS